MTTEQKAKAYDEAIKKAKKIKEKIMYSHLSTESCKAVSEYIDTIIPELREKPLTSFQQCLNCILRGVYYAKVPDEKVNEFILNVVRTRTDELIKLTKRHEYTDCQLRESEDERIRKVLINYFKGSIGLGVALNGVSVKDIVAYLEKQKENPKLADSIPADCASSAKCEDRWHKTANSLPDTGRDVLAKDALGNYLLASFDGAQWFVSVYDGQDHPVLHTPPILEWCDIPSETYKETLHISKTCKENAEYFTSQCGDNRFELIDKAKRDIIAKTNIESSPDEMKVLDSFLFRAWQMGWLGKYDVIVPDPKPAEWSEEDEKNLELVIDLIYKFYPDPVMKYKLKAWLKSLRPSWKPSEEQMEALRNAFHKLANTDVADSVRLSIMYDNLKKL